MTEQLRACDMEDSRRELAQVAANSGRDREPELVFRTPGDREIGDVDQIAFGFERGVLHRRRIDPDLGARPEQIIGEPVQRLVRAVADIIIVAAEDSHSKVACVH